MKNTLTTVEHKGIRVLTTEQLAQAYGCEPNNIKKNFNVNKEHFEEGKHYFKVSGNELNNLRVTFSNLQISPKTRCLYLWTRRGASRHCKMLGTERAWDMFDVLEENYFNPRPKELTGKELMAKALIEAHAVLEEQDKKIKELTPKAEFYDTVTGAENDWFTMNEAVKILNLGIGRNNTYKVLRWYGVLNEKNIPYQRYVDAGYFRLIETTWSHNDEQYTGRSLRVSSKGIDYIRKILQHEGYTYKKLEPCKGE